MFHPIPAPGFRTVSGKRAPADGTAYHVQFRNGFADERITYTAGQLKWIHEGDGFDVVAVRQA